MKKHFDVSDALRKESQNLLKLESPSDYKHYNVSYTLQVSAVMDF